jgi:diaminohydroxyphosphoribosylaminopyrimidine deaminase/5-amino-6-(5-phosphoribosylamino)uracil reductase|tara:strand:+ start:387 stop:1517 length:1131 start_codon:yes stop_codon:yes gene_type:complete
MKNIKGPDSEDLQMMAKALRLALKGKNTCMPNPSVGCVLAKNGKIIGEGWHLIAGQDHAEINALKSLSGPSIDATAYITLEPCNHKGKTGPCVDALVRAGIKRVVYGMADPNPIVSGQGLLKLKEAGISVEGPLLESEARLLNPGYIKRHQLGLPRITIKLAMSLDGRTAMGDGKSQWITGVHAREDVQKLRAQNCAIITGIGTVLHDDPSLSVRYKNVTSISKNLLRPKQPLLVVVDSKLKLPKDAKILTGLGTVLIATATESKYSNIKNLETVCIPDSSGKVDLLKLMKLLAKKECNNVLIESGPILAGAFMQLNLVDELVLYMAPKLLGNIARPLLSLPFTHLNQGIELDIKDIRQVGVDTRITAHIKNKVLM